MMNLQKKIWSKLQICDLVAGSECEGTSDLSGLLWNVRNFGPRSGERELHPYCSSSVPRVLAITIIQSGSLINTKGLMDNGSINVVPKTHVSHG